MENNTPVYLITGFLEAGKTNFIDETLRSNFGDSEGGTLIIVCEEGEEEYNPTDYANKNVTMVTVDSEEDLTSELLEKSLEKSKAERVFLEYNGMWQLSRLYEILPEGWYIYQELFIADASTIESYNKNMRSLVVDKLTSADLVAFNRADGKTDKEALHKLVRGVSRDAKILYDYGEDGIEYDEIEDPLPFDINADPVEIADRDYALWYRDLAHELEKYDGKNVSFKGIVLKDESIKRGEFLLGRHIMTCCADDIQYCPLVCKWKGSETLHSYDWVEVKGRISVERHEVYSGPGPVLKIKLLGNAEPADPALATFN